MFKSGLQNRSSELRRLHSIHCSVWSLSQAGCSDHHYFLWIYSKCPFNDKVIFCGDLSNKESLKKLNVVTKIDNFKLTWICAIKTMFCGLGFKFISEKLYKNMFHTLILNTLNFFLTFKIPLWILILILVTNCYISS